MKKSYLFILTVFFFMLTGCASTSPLQEQTHPSELPAPLAPKTAEYVDTIEMNGRFSMHYVKNNKPEAVHGKFIWIQTPLQTRITLQSPLNQIIAEINITPDEAMLISTGQVVRQANNVDELIARELGWPLPVSGLRTWLQGRAIDAEGKPFIAGPNADKVTTSDGWEIQFVSWQEDAHAMLHPKRIDLQRNSDDTSVSNTISDLSLRIIIDAASE